MTPLQLQLFTFLAVVLLGVALGFLFGLLRLWRRLLRPGRLAAHLADAAFAALAGALVLAGLLLVNWIQLRGFVVLALLVGAGLYLWLAAPWIDRVLVAAVVAAVRAAWFVGRRAAGAGRRLVAAVAPVWRRSRRPVSAGVHRIRRGWQEGRRRLASLLRHLGGFR